MFLENLRLSFAALELGFHFLGALPEHHVEDPRVCLLLRPLLFLVLDIFILPDDDIDLGRLVSWLLWVEVGRR